MLFICCHTQAAGAASGAFAIVAFSCVGRGESVFGRRFHEASIVRAEVSVL